MDKVVRGPHSRAALQILQQAASNGIDSVAGTAESMATFSVASNTLWQAALAGRDINSTPSTDKATDLQQLMLLVDKEQLLHHLLTSARHAVKDLGQRMGAAAAAARFEGHATSDAHIAMTKAGVLPAVQLLTTFAVIVQAWRHSRPKPAIQGPFSGFAEGMFLLLSVERTGESLSHP